MKREGEKFVLCVFVTRMKKKKKKRNEKTNDPAQMKSRSFFRFLSHLQFTTDGRGSEEEKTFIYQCAVESLYRAFLVSRLVNRGREEEEAGPAAGPLFAASFLLSPPPPPPPRAPRRYRPARSSIPATPARRTTLATSVGRRRIQWSGPGPRRGS